MKAASNLLRSLVSSLICVGLAGFIASLPASAQTPPDSGPPKTAPAKPEAAKDLPAAKDLVEKHVKAIGGKEAILKHTSKHMKASMMNMGQPIEMEIRAAKPNKLLVRVNTPMGVILQGYDGKVAWITGAMGNMILEGAQEKQFKAQADFYDDLKDPAKFKSMDTVAKEDFEGRPCYKVRFVSKEDEDEHFEYYDAQTGLQAGGTMDIGMGMPVTQVLLEYKDFGGVKTATKTRIVGTGQEFTIGDIEYDKVEASTFDLPAEIQELIKQQAGAAPAAGETPKPEAPKPSEPAPKP